MSTILEEAATIIDGARNTTYGDASDEFTQIAKAWSAYLDGRASNEISPLDYVNLLLLMKVMRARHGYHRDSYVDICGYSALAERLYEVPAQPVGTIESGLIGIDAPTTVPVLTKATRDSVWLSRIGDYYKYMYGTWWYRPSLENEWAHSLHGDRDVTSVYGPFTYHADNPQPAYASGGLIDLNRTLIFDINAPIVYGPLADASSWTITGSRSGAEGVQLSDAALSSWAVPEDTPYYPWIGSRAVRLTDYLRGSQWQSEDNGCVYWFVEGEWWCMHPDDESEDPWEKAITENDGVTVPSDEGPFVIYTSSTPSTST